MRTFLCVFGLLFLGFTGGEKAVAQMAQVPDGGGLPDPQLSQKDNDYLDRQTKVFLDSVNALLSVYPPGHL